MYEWFHLNQIVLEKRTIAWPNDGFLLCSINFAEDLAQGHQETLKVTAITDGLAEEETMAKVADVEAVVLIVIMIRDIVKCLHFYGAHPFLSNPKMFKYQFGGENRKQTTKALH